MAQHHLQLQGQLGGNRKEPRGGGGGCSIRLQLKKVIAQKHSQSKDMP